MIFTIKGKIQPYTRMTQRGKFVRNDAQLYLTSQAAMQSQFREQMLSRGYEMLDRVPLRLVVGIMVPGALHRCDLSNQIKAIEDALQGIAFGNDCWVDSIDASRGMGDEYLATVLVKEWEGEE
jgi:crossover junction endodeoxyribonuclease RusA